MVSAVINSVSGTQKGSRTKSKLFNIDIQHCYALPSIAATRLYLYQYKCK